MRMRKIYGEIYICVYILKKKKILPHANFAGVGFVPQKEDPNLTCGKKQRAEAHPDSHMSLCSSVAVWWKAEASQTTGTVECQHSFHQGSVLEHAFLNTHRILIDFLHCSCQLCSQHINDPLKPDWRSRSQVCKTSLFGVRA